MHNTDTVPLMTSKEVCAALGIDRSTLTRWVQDGKVTPAQKLPGLRGAYLFERGVLDRASK